MSVKIEEILQILGLIWDAAPQTMEEVREERIRAFNKIAAGRALKDNTTLHRACRDRLGNPSIRDFDRLIYRWLCWVTT